MSVDTGILLVRVLFGAAIAAHGAQKLFGWFGGYGLKGTGGFFEGQGFHPGVAFAAAAGLSEFVGGLFLVIGLFTPLGAAAVLGAMIVAMVSVHLKGGFFAATNGIEMPFLYAAAALGLLLSGGAKYSLDTEFGLTFLGQPYVVVGLFVLAIVGAIVTLAVRRQPQTQTSAG
jgi:putative oxidoreductase